MRKTGKFMHSKFKSQCAETKQTIKPGEYIFYHFKRKKAFCEASEMFKIQEENNKEERNLSAYIQDQENAYFDNLMNY